MGEGCPDWGPRICWVSSLKEGFEKGIEGKLFVSASKK